MATYQLDDAFAKAATCAQGPNCEFRDSESTGFLLRVSAKGKKSWQVIYTDVLGRRQRYKIGAFPAWDSKRARKRAGDVVRGADKGESAATQKQEQRHGLTFAELANKYVEYVRDEKHNRSAHADELKLAKLKKRWGKLPAIGITDTMVRSMFESMRAKPVMANRTKQLVCTLYNRAMRNQWVSGITNPAALIAPSQPPLPS